jgi:hypothetical protein
MQSLQRSIMALALLAISVAMAPAKDGRDFAGFYSLTGASPDGDQVHVTLTVQLYNYSGADLEQAAVAIRSGPPETITFGTYDAVREWQDGSDVKFAIHLTVPQAVYESWARLRQPAICIVNRDERGRTLERTAQVSRRTSIDLAGSNPSK